MSPLSYVISVLQAFFGVQSKDNRERDFEEGNPAIFLIVGLAITFIFMANVFLFVNYIVLGQEL